MIYSYFSLTVETMDINDVFRDADFAVAFRVVTFLLLAITPSTTRVVGAGGAT